MNRHWGTLSYVILFGSDSVFTVREFCLDIFIKWPTFSTLSIIRWEPKFKPTDLVTWKIVRDHSCKRTKDFLSSPFNLKSTPFSRKIFNQQLLVVAECYNHTGRPVRSKIWTADWLAWETNEILEEDCQLKSKHRL